MSDTGKPSAGAKSATLEKTHSKSLPPYNVVLLDDNDHSHEYVIDMMAGLFGHPREMGYLIATKVHTEGRAVVLTTHKEKAELKRDQIHAYGVDARVATCQGSMSSLIEPAPQ